MRKEEKIKSTEAKLPPNLPDEIVLDIQLRLPVRSLLRFKAACQSWRSLINDPTFVKMHLHRTQQGDNINLWRQCYVVDHSYPSSPLTLCLKSRGIEAFVGTKQEGPSKEFDVYAADIIGSCNGLVLVGFNDMTRFCLWNPSTGEYKNFSGQRKLRNGFTIWGLGYDSSSDDYKVVRAVRICRALGPGDEPYDATRVKFFTLKTNSWTETKWGDFHYKITSDGNGTVVNGAPHWVVTRVNSDLSYFPKIRVIVYFDPKEEKFEEVLLPIWLDKSLKLDLGVLGGCLCLSHNPGTHFEVSAMKEYGVQESWTKLFIVPASYESLRPLCFAKNGEVLMAVNQTYSVLYNLKNDTYTTILSVHDGWRLSVVAYMESLVSPSVQNRTGGQGKIEAHQTKP